MEQTSIQQPDNERRRRIMDFIMAAGQTLLENGAEVFRVEQTMEIMARSFHLREFQVYVLTNGIFASAGTAEMAEVRNVPRRTVHLGRVAEVNELSRRIAAGKTGLDEAEQKLAAIRKIPFPQGTVQVAAGTVGSAAFALMFGGGARDALAAAAAGALVSVYLLACQKQGIGTLFQKITGAALITAICILCSIWIGADVNHAAIGALMILTPGVAFTMGIRDFVQGDYLSGMIRMIDAVLVAACLACGAGLVLRLWAMTAGGGMLL